MVRSSRCRRQSVDFARPVRPEICGPSSSCATTTICGGGGWQRAARNRPHAPRWKVVADAEREPGFAACARERMTVRAERINIIDNAGRERARDHDLSGLGRRPSSGDMAIGEGFAAATTKTILDDSHLAGHVRSATAYIHRGSGGNYDCTVPKQGYAQHSGPAAAPKVADQRCCICLANASLPISFGTDY
uniref:SCP domain-containing protein n=1 Tax=Steinernema glaseri TaxID=37863 RepID=A0A1I8AVT3_9BILA